MRFELRIEVSARRDVVDVLRWLDQRSGRKQARAFAVDLRQSLDVLCSFPRFGRARAVGPARVPVRSWRLRRFRRYLVIYWLRGTRVHVLRIVDGTRNLDSLQTEPGNGA